MVDDKPGVLSALPNSPIRQKHLDQLETHDKIDRAIAFAGHGGGSLEPDEELVSIFLLEIDGEYRGVAFDGNAGGWVLVSKTNDESEAMGDLRTYLERNDLDVWNI